MSKLFIIKLFYKECTDAHLQGISNSMWNKMFNFRVQETGVWPRQLITLFRSFSMIFAWSTNLASQIEYLKSMSYSNHYPYPTLVRRPDTYHVFVEHLQHFITTVVDCRKFNSVQFRNNAAHH